MLMHGLENPFGGIGLNNRDQLAFVCHIQGIKSQHLACALDFFPNWNRVFFKFDPHVRSGGDLVQRTRQATARWVAKAANVKTRAKHAGNKRVQRRRIACNCAFEFKAFSLREYRDPMISNGPTQQHAISWARLIGGKPHSGCDHSNSRGVHK